MPLILSEEQKMLKTSAKEYLKSNANITQMRSLRDQKDPNGFDQHLWEEMGQMGWTALTIPEEYGGMGFGYVGLGQILEESGRTLTASPLISSVLLGAEAIIKGGSDAQKSSLLPAIAEGKSIATMAFEEHNLHRPYKITSKAEKQGSDYVISGIKKFVLNAHVANHMIVSALTGDRISLFIVDAASEGIQITKKKMMDSQYVSDVTFDNVKAHSILGAEGEGKKILDHVLVRAVVGQSAEMLGSMQEAFERTMAFIKERMQFGVRIGSFQALQHRSAEMFSEIELCKSMVLKSLQSIDQNDAFLPAYASMTKAKLGEVLELVTNECIQMFGGIGVTDDEDIGLFMKRARVVQQTFGDTSYHLDRFAKLSGF